MELSRGKVVNPILSQQKLIIFVASDSAGETGEAVVKAAATQFYPKVVEIRRIAFIQDSGAIELLIQAAKREHAIIVFTLVVPELREYLLVKARKHHIKTIDLMGNLLQTMEHSFGQEARHKPGMIHPLDEDYFKKVEAVEFAVKYDDGRDFTGILQADIVLVGVSRTSKTPLSMFLAHKTYKVANVPLVPEITPPDLLYTVNNKKIFGLTINPDKLNKIRSERLKMLGLPGNASYANLERISQELEFAQQIMSRIGCTVIDVTNKAVEETASVILERIG
ncbi:pyruvate, water dikinase regulatory protein [Paenibacillus thalictri]|uniref:pyruvate, water dikinase regulatory protein n=1 Tax=Paenibacillus thalictri TaxID=2527873 RepID=UPI001478C6FA|nr:pyruvate, water dikinase regulatory protein [Paenibacillus thalictri]